MLLILNPLLFRIIDENIVYIKLVAPPILSNTVNSDVFSTISKLFLDDED